MLKALLTPVQVFETATLRPAPTWNFLDIVSDIEWSPDNKYVLVSINKRGLAFVRSLYDPAW